MRYQIRVTQHALDVYSEINPGDNIAFQQRAIHQAWMRSDENSIEAWINTLKRDGNFYIIPINLADFRIQAVED